MKKIVSFFLIIGIIQIQAAAQQKKIDSLKQLITLSRLDSNRINLLNELCFVTWETNPEEGLRISQQADSLAKMMGFRKGEARALDLMGDALQRLSNYPKSMEVQLESLKINEELKDPGAMAGCMISLASLHAAKGQSRIALDYLFEAEKLARSVNDQRRILYSTNNIGSLYSTMGLNDSALFFLNQAYAMEIKWNEPITYTARSLSYLHFKMGNKDLGNSYLKMAEQSALETENHPLLADVYMKKARIFKEENRIDSATYYAKRAFDICMSLKLTGGLVSSAGFLSGLYTNELAESFRYHKISDSANAAIYNLEKDRAFQNLAFNEKDRQLKLEKEKQQSEDERKKNLQYAAIVLGLILFILFYLFLSRSVIINSRMIEFLGVIALLIVFEFLNLLLHPFLERITHHSPVLMLLALVCIAALLVPLHHRLQKWMTSQLVEKNKKIRLEAAKKTIAKLEKE